MIHIFKPYPFKVFITYNKLGKWIKDKNNKTLLRVNNGWWVRKEYNEDKQLIFQQESNGLKFKYAYQNKKLILAENSRGFWIKYGYDDKGKKNYLELYDGYWERWENDKKGRTIHKTNGRIA